MNRWIILSLAASAVAGSIVLPTLDPVELQPSTPGTAQTGNVNITGRLLAGGVTATTSGAGGQAVVGQSNAGSGFGIGGLFKCSSPSGTAVRGYATAASGFAYGGDFQSDGPTGTAVRGIAPATEGANFGFYGKTTSSEGIAVYGWASSTTGTNYGAYFKSSSSSGVGVRGLNNFSAGTTTGGLFGAMSKDGRGVYAYATSLTGETYGVKASTGSNATGYALYADGRFAASGTKSFRIDHPKDPENMYLSHYCAEGPQPLNIYRGSVVTDGRGYAWVQLPDYYADINRDPTYQLTVVNGDFVQAIVCQEIDSNRFRVRTSKAGVKVCWEVKAVRNDAYVRTYGAPVETLKPESQRGRYQHPELFGKPKELGIDYMPDQDEQREDPAPSGQHSLR